MNSIVIRDLVKTYKMGLQEVQALRGISVEVDKNEYLAIIRNASVLKRSLYL